MKYKLKDLALFLSYNKIFDISHLHEGLKELKNIDLKNESITLIGYENYSELLVSKIRFYLEKLYLNLVLILWA